MIFEVIAVSIIVVAFAFMALVLLSNPSAGDIPDWYWEKIDEELADPNSEIPKEVLLAAKHTKNLRG